jgi:hypothetical protein
MGGEPGSAPGEFRMPGSEREPGHCSCVLWFRARGGWPARRPQPLCRGAVAPFVRARRPDLAGAERGAS